MARKILRDLDEDSRDFARALVETPAYEATYRRRKKVEMLFAPLKRILRLARLRLRGPCGAKDECVLAVTAQNFRRLARSRPESQWRHKPPTLAAPPPPRRRTAKLLQNAPDAGSGAEHGSFSTKSSSFEPKFDRCYLVYFSLTNGGHMI